MLISDWSSDVCSSDLGRIGGDVDAVFHAETKQGALLQVRMQFHLIHGRFDASVVEQMLQFPGAEIGNADIACQSAVHATFHRSEERRVGQEWCSTCRSRCAHYH